MALKFEYIYDLSDISIEPDVVSKGYITNEPSGALLNYIMYNKDEAAEKVCDIDGAVDYKNINFDTMTHRLTIAPVDKIGIKSFPTIGSYGFYKDKYSGITKIVVPINRKRDLFAAPSLSFKEENNRWYFSITNPDTVEYNCFRILLVNGDFAYEYITYDLEFDCEIPPVKGLYRIYCMGYRNETEYVSDISNIFEKTVTEGKDSFGPDSTMSYYTKEQIDSMLGQIGELLDKINGVVI